jgi:O-antigen/teichoic acid export membrane protein
MWSLSSEDGNLPGCMEHFPEIGKWLQRRYALDKWGTNYLKDPLYKNSLFLILGNVFNSFCGYLFWILAARLYSIEDVGSATALISSLGLVVLFSTFGFDFSIIRFFHISDKSKAFSTSLAVTIISSSFIGLAFIILFETSSQAFFKNHTCTLIFLFSCILYSISYIAGRAIIAAGMGEYYFFQHLLFALRIPCLIPLLFLGSLGIFISFGISYLLGTIFSLILLKKIFKTICPKIDKKFMQSSLNFSLKNYIANILSSAPTMIIPIMVLNSLGEIEAAKYYIAYALGNLALIFPTAISTSLFIEGSHRKGLKDNVIRSGKLCSLFLIPTVAILLIFGERLLLLLGKDYVGAYDLLRIVVLSSLFVSIYSLFIPIQNVRMNVDSIVKLNLMRFILILGMCYLFMLKFGLLGTGYAWILTYAIISLWIIIVAKREKWI